MEDQDKLRGRREKVCLKRARVREITEGGTGIRRAEHLIEEYQDQGIQKGKFNKS